MSSRIPVFGIRLLAFGASLLSALLPQAVNAINLDPKKPNIVFVMVDDLGLYDLNCYGFDAVDTPYSNQLAKDGMLFTRAYAGAPVCSPSRAAVMSGQAPARLHLTNHISNAHFAPENAVLLNAPEIKALPIETVTYAERLRDAGYACGFFGKWHLSLQKPNSGGRVVDEDTLPDNQGFLNNLGGNGNGGPAGGWFSPYANPYLENGPDGEYLPHRLAREAVDFIEVHKDRPFLINMWNYTVHSPIETTDALKDKYKARKRAGAEIGNPTYAGMIEAADTLLGRILDKIDELGLRENTIVILTSDNGGFNYVSPSDKPRLRRTKGWLYDGGLRIPMIVRWPGKIEPGTVSDELVTHLDLYPTLMDVANIKLPADQILDGDSLLPTLTQQQELERDAVYFHYPNYAWHAKNRLGGVIIEGDYKLLNWYDDDSVELYKITEDISEINDLSKQNPELSDRLKKKLQRWLKDVDANMPPRNPDYVAE
ncbi:sulfatase [Coraliomargarita akajimensis]|uniref:Sulfatase n=1 Tax=Coraliomargarita akajimensis (strain DSM 45221 / IAM 15411 / JCM 23193 / KCTC 12865 / 04OKA010-24) TaxID=583355 RepID=D5ENZ2_CORAD|nr:sulfatase [Coraliomargarita akajimensis]ADE53651.1 sulfatase [Coraliomargarita akajimensis DSM 45221]